jgi:hypothetical protein
LKVTILPTIASVAETSWLDQGRKALRLNRPEVVEKRIVQEGGRIINFRFSFRESEAEQEVVDKRIAGGSNKRQRLLIFFRPPIRECEYCYKAGIRFLFEATNFLEIKDSVRFKTLNKACRKYYKVEFEQYLDNLLKGPG